MNEKMKNRRNKVMIGILTAIIVILLLLFLYNLMKTTTKEYPVNNANYSNKTTPVYTKSTTSSLLICNFYDHNNSEMVLYKGNTINENNIIPFSSGIEYHECQKYTNMTNGVYTIVSNFPNMTSEIWDALGFNYTISPLYTSSQNATIINESGNKITFLLSDSDVMIVVFPEQTEHITLKNNCKNSFLYFFSGNNASLNSKNNLIEIIAYNTTFTANDLQATNYTLTTFSPNPNTKITWNIENPYYKTILYVEPLWFYKITTSQGPQYYSFGSIENPIIYNKSISIPTNTNLTNLYFYRNIDIYSNITITCN